MKSKVMLTVVTAIMLAGTSTIAAAAPVPPVATPQPVAGAVTDGSGLHGEGFIIALFALAAIIAGAVIAARGGGKPLTPVSP